MSLSLDAMWAAVAEGPHHSVTTFLLFMFSHISGNKIGWEKTGSHSEPQARGDPGDQTKVVGQLLFLHVWTLSM